MLVRFAVVLFAYFCACAVSLAGELAPSKPNIIIVLADDFGHGHASCYNPEAKFKTPNIDRLAAEGIKFTDAHSGSAVCSPTRYGLLTGRYAWRTRLRAGVLFPGAAPLIERERLTLPAMLKSEGYHTACFGKWHLGWEWPKNEQGKPDYTAKLEDSPLTRGFDYYFGMDCPNFFPYAWVENDHLTAPLTTEKTKRDLDGLPGPMAEGWKFDEILPELTQRCAAHIEARAKEKASFFVYFPLTSPHEPVAPSEAWRGKSGLDNALADFVLESDAALGSVMKAVERAGIAENTLLIFTCDNGSGMYTGGQDLKKKGHDPNAGFRGAKASIYEGGHRVPFIARWPGKIKAGAECAKTICLTDMMATVASVTGHKLPENSAEDSADILPLLTGTGDAAERAPVVHQSANGLLAIRKGKWKLILGDASAGTNVLAANEPKSQELYDLETDPAETKNVVAEHAEVAAELKVALEKFETDGRSVGR